MSDKPEGSRPTNRLALLPKTELGRLSRVLDQMLDHDVAEYHLTVPGSGRINSTQGSYDKCATIINGLFPLKEVINPHELAQAFKRQSTPRSIWGLAPRAPMHLGYDRFILKQLDLIRSGCLHTVLLADLEVGLTSPHLDEADLSLRSAYYQEAMSAVFGLSEAEFCPRSSFQFDRDYISHLMRTLSDVRVLRAYRATPGGATDSAHLVMWQSKGTAAVPKYQEFPADISDRDLASLVYPVMQALDAYHQRADIVLGDFGQKQIYANIGRDNKLRQLLAFDENQSVPVLLFLENSSDILGKPMVKSKQADRITFHETPETLRHKINRIVAPEFIVDCNPLIEICRYSVLPWIKEPLIICRKKSRPIEVSTLDELANDYRLGHIHPSDLKTSILEPLRLRIDTFQQHFAQADKRHLVSWIDVKSNIENCLESE